MNDLAEQALRGVQAARKQVLARPMLCTGIAGFAASALCVYAGGRLGTALSVIPLTGWLGVQSGADVSGDRLPGALLLLGIVALCACWLIVLRVLRTGRYGERTVWWLSGAWALPLAAGPPLLDGSVYAYVGRGLISRTSRSPYLFGPSVLGDVPAVAAIDPSQRTTPSTAGPLATFGQHLAVTISAGNPLIAVLLYRALGVLCMVAVGLLAAELAGPRRVPALAITIANPLLLLYVVSAAHVEGLLAALLLGAVVAASHRHWGLAVLLSCAAGALAQVALVAVVVIIAAHATGQRTRAAWQLVARDALLAAACLAVATLSIRHGLAWTQNLHTLTRAHTSFTPASLLADVLSPVVSAASFDDLTTGGRITALAAAACIVAYLLATLRSRPMERTIGFALLAIALLAPAVRPWYLIWGLSCLAPTAVHARREWVIAFSCVGCLLAPPGLGETASNTITAVVLVIAAVALLPRTMVRRRAALLGRRSLNLGG